MSLDLVIVTPGSGADFFSMPRIASALALLLCAAVCVGLLVAPASASTRRQAVTIDSGVLAQLNQIRSTHQLAPLELNTRLSAAAEAHSRDMLTRAYFAHDTLGGRSFWKRIESYYPPGGASYWAVGENLFWSSGPVDATTGIDAWMASPEHRANILSPRWREIGIASVSGPTARGAFDGLGVTLITTDFGVRR